MKHGMHCSTWDIRNFVPAQIYKFWFQTTVKDYAGDHVSELCVASLFHMAWRFFLLGFEVNEGVEHKE